MKRIRDLSLSRTILLFTTLIIFFVLIVSTVITYSIFFGTTNQVVEDTSREINKQIIMNYENYIFDVIDVADYVTKTTLEYSKKESFEQLYNLYNATDEVNENIASITLLGLDGSKVYTSQAEESFGYNLSSKDWFLAALSDDSIYHFSLPHNQDVYPEVDHRVITISRLVTYFSDGLETEGVLVIELEVTNFDNLSQKTNLGDTGHILIVDEDYNTIYTNKTSCYLSCDSKEVMESVVLGGSFTNINDTDVYMNVNTISLTRWRIATFVNAENVSEARNTVIISLIIAFIGVFALAIYISSLFSKRMTSPISRLNEYMKEFEKGIYVNEIHLTGQREVIELGDSFNQMVLEIRRLVDQVYAEQKAKRKTQFIALQNQINPHFLYNTLDSILYLNESKDNEKVEQMIVALSRFFRISISSEQNIIPLSEELEHIKQYLLIQQIRYHNRFTYSFSIDESLMDFKVLKLGLQPIVENAIYHGINPEGTNNEIKISVFDDETYVYIEVWNNGYGISEEDIEDLYKTFDDNLTTKHIGLKNISQRLNLYYGEEAKIIILSELDEYTKVQLRFPKGEV